MSSGSEDEPSSAEQSRSAKRDAEGNLKVYDDSFRSPSDIVRLNVGGTHYEVSRDTLMRYERSMLASLLSGKWKEGVGEDEIFIDRNGRRFEWILDYLRSDRVYVPDLCDESALKEELEYFGINADLSKISVQDDFVALHELAAIKESYRLASDYTSATETQSLYMRLEFSKDVDKEMLRRCLLSGGLYVANYGSTASGTQTVHLCVVGIKDECAL